MTRPDDHDIEILEGFSDLKTWDSYVEQHPESRFCHLSGYSCLQRVYGYRPHLFAFRRNSQLVGVLPLFELKTLLRGRRLISQPFSEYGGILLDDGLSQPDIDAIMNHLRSFARSLGVPDIEMHGHHGFRVPNWDRWLRRGNEQQYAYMSLDRPIDEIWTKVVTYQVRKAVQKASRHNLTVVERSDPETLRTWFHPLYIGSMNRLGVPAHSLRYYLLCKEALGDRMRIFWAIKDGNPIAGLLGFSCGGRVNIVTIVSDERYWEIRPNDLIHWEYVRWAHAEGFKVFDFGSIRYEGQLHFKKKWGCVIDEHAYYFLPADPESAKSGSFDSSSPLMAQMSSIWSRFMPAPVARVVGPVLRRQLGR